MVRIIHVAWCAVLVSASIAVFAADGATSPSELRQLYQRYFALKDEQKLATLVYWPGVEQRDRAGFLRSVRGDLNHRLRKIDFVSLDAGAKLEYTLDGVVYAPALPPVGRMVISFEDEGAVTHLSTSYLVGVKDGRYYVDLAAPKREKEHARRVGLEIATCD